MAGDAGQIRGRLSAVELPVTGRMRVLAAMEEDLADTEVLLSALQHAVAGLDGLGGMVHLWGQGATPGLRLVVASGLPRSFTQGWDTVWIDEQTAPARAVRDGALVWLPPPDATRRVSVMEAPVTTELPSGLSADAGMAAVPLPMPQGPRGALSVVTAQPDEPDPAQRALLGEVAGWAAGRLRKSSSAAREVAPDRPSARSAEQRLQQALNSVLVGAWDWDLRTDRVTWNEPMHTVLGINPAAFDGRIETWKSIVHPDDLPWVAAEFDRALRARGGIEYEHRVCHPDGTRGWVRVRGQVIVDESGEPARMLGTLWDTTEDHEALESVGRALRHMSDGFLAVGGDWRITFVNVEAEHLFGSSRGLVGRVLWDVPAIQKVPDLEERCRQAAANGSPTGFDIHWPDDRRYHLRLVPVPDGLTAYFTDVTDKRRHEAERLAAERAAADRAVRTAELTAALAEAVTVRDVVAAVADRVLPPFGATGLLVQVREGDYLNTVGAVGYSQAFLDRVQRLPAESPVAIAVAFRNRVPKFVSSPQELLTGYPHPEIKELLAQSAQRAWAFLPLVASDRSVGACVVSFSEPRRFTDEERTLLGALSGLVAQALERARLYDAEHTRAQELQRGLLPRRLPSLPAVSAAARYLPAGQGVEVGGDWYDVIPLSADRVALVIGDVMGHGLPEAVTMGRLRTAVHTLADLELPPDEVLGHLNDIVSDLGDDFYATCLYAVYDPATRNCTFGTAGHLPPAIVHPDGVVRFPDLVCNAPLGAAEPPFDTVDLELPEGSLLVLYTDGLVESGTRDFDQGMAHLARTLTDAVHPDGLRRDGSEGLDALCDALTAGLLPAQQQTSDDTALLVVRTHWLTPENVASWSLPEDPVAAGQARDHIRDQLARWNLEDLTTTTELLASELVGNVVRHARGPIRLRLLRSRTLICEVSDGSLTTPHIRRASDTDEGGRGLQLVAALSQRWGTRFTGEGKCIWTEQSLPAAL